MSNKQNRNRQEHDEYWRNMMELLAQQPTLEKWNAFAKAMDVPQDIYPALATGRSELLELVRPRDMNAVEVRAMLDMLTTLIRTNHLLQRHAQEVSKLVDNWGGAFRQLASVGERIKNFAAFRNAHEDEEADEAAE